MDMNAVSQEVRRSLQVTFETLKINSIKEFRQSDDTCIFDKEYVL